MVLNIRGILAVAGSTVAIFWPGALIFGFPGVMGPYWERLFHIGLGPIGNTLFFVLFAVGLFMSFVGHWQERFGTRKMMTIGAFICGLSLIITAYASHIYMLYLWGFLIGLSSCFIYIPALTTVQRWYPARKGLVSGIVSLAFGSSAAIMSPIFAYMLESMNYFAMNITVGVIALAVGVIAAQFTEIPEKVRSKSPEPEAPEKFSAKYGDSLSVGETVRTKSFWFLWLTWVFQVASGMSMVTLSTAFGLSRGLAMESAVLILVAFNIMNGFSRILMGYLSDTLDRNSSMSIAFFAAGCAHFALPYVSTLAFLALFAAVIGFAFGTLFAVSAPLVADCFGFKHFGAILGLIFTTYFVSGVIGPSLSGYLLDVFEKNFMIVFMYLGIFCMLSSFFVRFVVPPRPLE